MRITSLNISTTGISETDEIIRVTCSVPNYDEYITGLDVLICPQEHINWNSAYNGLTIDDLSDCPSYNEVRNRISEYLSEFDTIVCFNSDFVIENLPGIDFTGKIIIDLMKTSSELMGEFISIENEGRQYKNVSFAKALERFAITLSADKRYDTSENTKSLLALYFKINKYYPKYINKKYFYKTSVA